MLRPVRSLMATVALEYPQPAHADQAIVLAFENDSQQSDRVSGCNQAFQCRKWRTPVSRQVTPRSSQRAKVSSSRFEPPGWIRHRTPASISSSGPSANGKNASLAATGSPAPAPKREQLQQNRPGSVGCVPRAAPGPSFRSYAHVGPEFPVLCRGLDIYLDLGVRGRSAGTCSVDIAPGK